MRKTASLLAAPLTMGLLLGGTALVSPNPAAAADMQAKGAAGASAEMKADKGPMKTTDTVSADADDVKDANDLVADATGVVEKMRQTEGMDALLAKAKGIYIVPEYGKAGAVVSGEGGSGVLLSHEDGEWTAPGFYDFGGLSFGAEAGVKGGSVAFVILSDDGMKEFTSDNNFSLDADAGLTIVNYSADAKASYGKGDIVMWSDTKGAYAGAGVSASNIVFNKENTKGYYGEKVTPNQIVSGSLESDKASKLEEALSG
ncbi:lipid-binding SYLF domain-containing protein [Parvibaculum indicum]|uniref:lipid-binding SYLF domain-containing protein n=1 Tax=Parvibaculum indicum TaxID=562969 RepID=UPI001420CCE0|nr:lipid-binding SYLF domain-containing protein [Parvibaculum indicum]NIJ43363.1 lipid-binding SYLF domain-containing protein [Parvibaculum indicum]